MTAERLAHRLVAESVKRGMLIRPNTCEKCLCKCYPAGHHEDYSKPLEVIWLCRSCHKQHHADKRQSEETITPFDGMKTTNRNGATFVRVAAFVESDLAIHKFWVPVKNLPAMSGKTSFWRIK